MSNIKYLDNYAKFLLDSGLLFEINRILLHPHGLALEITVEDDMTASISGIWDYRDDDEGMTFHPDVFKEGLRKYNEFLKDRKEKLEKRKEILGYILQGERGE